MPKKKIPKKTAKKKASTINSKKAVKTSSKKKTPSKSTKKQVTIKRKPRSLKCCKNCQDYEYCKDKGVCCNYCDFHFKGKCMYEKEKDLLPRGEGKIEITDYRGDDYGIDDYEAYEAFYE